MGRIARLSEDLVNKIAAGEVVERPASVIKELVENAVDAGARTVRVKVEDGGLASIQVTDDGHGMSREDATLALERHATSKLKDLAGLSRILTLGFRGEAIPAIASVSRFLLHTSEPSAAVGTRITVGGGGEANVEDAAPIFGTVISADELFFNTPARRKFLKRPQTELQHVEEALLRIALAHPEISFSLEADGRTVFTSPGSGDVRERIAAALGTEVHAHLAEVDERRLDATIKGYVASPEFTLPTQRGLYTLVNGRFIKDRGLNHTIQRAYQESLPPGRQPVAVLFLELDPRDVDVNVHPQKLEVRFADPRSLYEGVFAGVQRALRASPWMRTQAQLPQSDSLQGAHYAAAVEKFLARAQEGIAPPSAQDAPLFPAASPEAAGFGQLRPTLNEAPPPGYFASLRHLGNLARKFLVCEGAHGSLVVLDPHAARERVHLSAVLSRLAGRRREQPYLFNATVELSPSTAKALFARLDALLALDLELEPFGGSSVALKSVPPELAGANHASLLESLASALPPPGSALDARSLEEAARVIACHAAEREFPSEAESKSLLAELEAASFDARASHGKIVVAELTLLDLLRRSG